MAGVEAVFLELLAELEEALPIDVDAPRWTPRIVLPDEEEHRHLDAFDVRDGIAAPVALRHIHRRAAEEIGVVFLERFHLVLVRGDVVADRNDPDPNAPPLRLDAEPEEREITAPGSTGQDGALPVGDAELHDPVLYFRDVLELGESRLADDRVAPQLPVAARAPGVDENDGETMVDPRLVPRGELVAVMRLGAPVNDQDGRMRTAALGLSDEDVDALDVDVLVRRPGRSDVSGRAHDDAVAPADDRGLGRALPHVPDVAVGPHPRFAHAARLSRDAIELLRREIDPVELASPAVVVCDEERARVRVPVGGDLTREVDRDLLLPAGRGVEDERSL